MTDANSFRSAVIVLLMFAAIYFVALGIYELKKWIVRILKRKENK